MALLGNVSVGKTSLFGRLCGNGEHAVNIPGSTQRVTRGVLTIGAGAAPRAFKRQCGSCGASSRARRGGPGPACETPSGECPGLKGRQGWRAVRRRPRAFGPSALDSASESAWDSRDGPLLTHLYDTPGSATLAATGEDEVVARDLILSGRLNGVVLVADAKNLRRSLALALEVAEFGLPMILNLNMLDEAESMGLEIDDDELARILRVPVNRTIAVEDVGVRQLAELIPDAEVPTRGVTLPDSVESGLSRLEQILENPVLAARGLGLLLLAGDRGAQAWVREHLSEGTLDRARAIVEEVQGSFTRPLSVLIADRFHAEADRIADRAVTTSVHSPGLLVQFGRLAQRPLSGALIGLGVLVLAYLWVGAFGASFVVDAISVHVFQDFLTPLCQQLVAPIPSAFVRDAIMDPDFGLISTGLFLAVGLVLPVLFCFFLLQAVLEDSGYLPRLAVLFDRIFRWFGLNGQGLISLVLGFSCITMAVITARMLPTRRERLILTILVLGIPCAPLLAVMLVILGRLPWTAGAVVFGLVMLRILVMGYFAGKFIPGELPDLIMELPQMRIPRPRVLLVKTWRRTMQFLREALPLFLLASFVVFLVDRAGGLALLEELAHPVVHGLLGLPDQAVQVFIKTAIRRESGAAELNLLYAQFDNLQLVVTLLVMTFVMPCVNAAIVIIKERGLSATVGIVSTVMAFAIATGAIVNLVCRGLGIDFA
jgi:ferrous iron transport protein B